MVARTPLKFSSVFVVLLTCDPRFWVGNVVSAGNNHDHCKIQMLRFAQLGIGSLSSNIVFEFLFLGASGLDETRLIKQITETTDVNVLPVNNSLYAVNVTLDITFHGVIDLVKALF